MIELTRRQMLAGTSAAVLAGGAEIAYADQILPKRGQKLSAGEQELASIVRASKANLASLYDDYYMRCNPGDNGQIPRVGNYCLSPDIWPSGASPLSDPANFLKNSYGTQSPAEVLLNQKNFIYVRSRNLGPDNKPVKARLYYVPANITMWPQLWTANFLKTDGGIDTQPMKGVPHNMITATESAFTWTPTKPNGADHYCLCAQLITTPHPNAIPTPQYFEGLAGWLLTTPGIGWKNVAVVDRNAPTWQSTFAYKNDPTTAAIYVLIDCAYVPNDCFVSLSCGDAGPNPQINIPKTQITTSPSWSVGLVSTIPASFQSTFTLSFWKGAQPLTSQLQIGVRFIKVVNASSYAESYFAAAGLLQEYKTEKHGNIKGFQFGDVHFRLSES